MKEVVASIHKNELVGRRWLLSYALMEIVVIYLLFCDQSLVHEVDQRCAYIKENNQNLYHLWVSQITFLIFNIQYLGECKR